MAVKRVVLLVLKSPRFLYREVGGGAGSLTTWRPGCRSACGIRCPTRNCSTPRRPASSPRASRSWPQAERMLADLRAQAKLREFLLTG